MDIMTKLQYDSRYEEYHGMKPLTQQEISKYKRNYDSLSYASGDGISLFEKIMKQIDSFSVMYEKRHSGDVFVDFNCKRGSDGWYIEKRCVTMPCSDKEVLERLRDFCDHLLVDYANLQPSIVFPKHELKLKGYNTHKKSSKKQLLNICVDVAKMF